MLAGRNMTGRIAALLALTFTLATPLPLAAQPDDSDDGESSDSLIERGANLLFRGIMTELAPGLDEMARDLGTDLGLIAPAMGDLAQLMDDIQNYDPPERLENGDIIIRRKADAPPAPPIGDGLLRLLPHGDDEGEFLPVPRNGDRYDPAPQIDL